MYSDTPEWFRKVPTTAFPVALDTSRPVYVWLIVVAAAGCIAQLSTLFSAINLAKERPQYLNT
jgi:hypothetical protein